MRGVITCSGIIVVIALIVMIHASITGNNIRRDEVNRSLDGAMDLHLTGWVMYMLINILQHMMLGKTTDTD